MQSSSYLAGKEALKQFALYLAERPATQVFLLMDANTETYCYPRLISKVPALQEATSFRIPDKENQKTL